MRLRKTIIIGMTALMMAIGGVKLKAADYLPCWEEGRTQIWKTSYYDWDTDSFINIIQSYAGTASVGGRQMAVIRCEADGNAEYLPSGMVDDIYILELDGVLYGYNPYSELPAGQEEYYIGDGFFPLISMRFEVGSYFIKNDKHYTVKSIDYVEDQQGVLRKRINFNTSPGDESWVEGIGYLSTWTMVPLRGPVATMMPPYMYECYQDGDLIFTAGDFAKEAADVESIHIDYANSTRIFDLMGREVKDLQPGSIYICDGKKMLIQR